jgi:hypothetical protein
LNQKVSAGVNEAEAQGDLAGEDDGVIIEFIPAEDVPAEHRKDNKVFEPGHQAIVMKDAKHPDGPVLYFTEAEWDAFIEGVKDGEFDDLLEDLPEDLPGETPEGS